MTTADSYTPSVEKESDNQVVLPFIAGGLHARLKWTERKGRKIQSKLTLKR